MKFGVKNLLTKNTKYKGKTLYEVLYANNQVDKFSKKDISDTRGNTYKNQEMDDFGFYI